jgi:hypothetical protein
MPRRSGTRRTNRTVKRNTNRKVKRNTKKVGGSDWMNERVFSDGLTTVRVNPTNWFQRHIRPELRTDVYGREIIGTGWQGLLPRTRAQRRGAAYKVEAARDAEWRKGVAARKAFRNRVYPSLGP